MSDRFPIGAWISGPETSGGIVNGRFLPHRGQVVAWGTLGRSRAYRIKFGESLNMILATDAVCDSCGTRDNARHLATCYEAFMRGKRLGEPDGYETAHHQG